MELEESDVPAYHQWAATNEVSAVFGKKLKIETTPNGEEIFVDIPDVPEGKIHDYEVKLLITERDA